MDDAACRAFFERPTQTYHRRYEALRAVFVDQRSQKDVAIAFGFTYGTMRQLVREFRRYRDDGQEQFESPFFETSTSDAQSSTVMTSLNPRWPTAGNSSSRRANR